MVEHCLSNTYLSRTSFLSRIQGPEISVEQCSALDTIIDLARCLTHRATMKKDRYSRDIKRVWKVILVVEGRALKSYVRVRVCAVRCVSCFVSFPPSLVPVPPFN